MPKVKNLVIQRQTGSDMHYASWAFDGDTVTKTTSNGSIKKGDLVTIKSGAKWYNGASIPSWVMSDSWYVLQVKGDRAVLDKNQSGNHSIESPINVKYLNGGSGGSSSSTTTTTSVSTLEEYEVKWTYDTGDGIWFSGGESTTKETYSTYNAPENANRIRIRVKPIAKKRTVNNKEVAYWTGTAVTVTYSITGDPPDQLSAPDVEIEKYKLTASLENIEDAKCDKVEFQVLKGTTVVSSGKITVTTAQAHYSCTIDAGGMFRVRCRAINLNNSKEVYGEWSPYSTPQGSMPSTPSEITEIKADSETSIYLKWSAVESADTYDIQYTTETKYFDVSDQVTTASGIDTTEYILTGIETGDEYFFRVRAVNEHGESGWSGYKSVKIGDKPSAPTTWSSSTTVITGETLNLYWVHNSEDGSSETFAELELTVDGVKMEPDITIENTETDEDLKDKTKVYSIDTTSYTEGTKIEWRVRTAGVMLQYGDWSVMRTVDIYAPPSLELRVIDADENALSSITSFPFYIYGLAGPNTQAPIGYHLTITSDETYETVDEIGDPKIVNIGDEVYSNYFDISEELMVEMSAHNIDLENNMSYTVTCVVSMDSGLTSTATAEFSVAWSDEAYEPDAGISIDEDTFTAYISPYCTDDEGNLIEGVTLSVYRREFDGGYKEIATGLDNNFATVVTDPHPALDYARYRIVCTTSSTGAVSFYDPPGYPVGGTAVIIQWDEIWSNFDAENSDELVDQPWAGSFLKLPYNIDVSDNNDPDVALVEFIGRENPVTYYGTHRGEKATWNVVIEAEDKDTLYALRRLKRYMGDVYVREPSGSGYWANIKVSFSQKHLDLTIPITLDIARVDGGI